MIRIRRCIHHYVPQSMSRPCEERSRDGTIDAIATDHAPHDLSDKEVEFDQAPVGIIGLETSLPLTLRLVDEGVLPLADAIVKLTWGPSQVLGLGKGTLQVGLMRM